MDRSLRPLVILGAILFCTLLTLAALLANGGSGQASHVTFVVATTADYVDSTPGDGLCRRVIKYPNPIPDIIFPCSLRAAIMEANAHAGADTITLPAGTYALTRDGADENAAATGDLDITSDLTINGAGAAAAIIDGGALDRVFHVVSGTVSISSVTIRNGNPGSFGSGGGIFNSGALTLANSTVSGNTAGAGGRGGGIYNVGGAVTLSNSTISGNTSDTGGGIRNSSDGAVTLANSTVSGNTADFSGGGILNSGALTLTSSTVSGNTTRLGGGILNGGALTLTNSTVSGNTADGGGGIDNGGAVTLVNSTVTGNTAPGGGGGILNSGALTLTSSTVSGNTSGSNGGGIYNSGSESATTLTNSTVSGNRAGSNGGGIYNSNGALTLTNSTVSGNTTGGSGGGIRNNSGSGSATTLTNSTVSGNTARFFGGGIANDGGALTIANSTVTNNTADSDGNGTGDGGGIARYAGAVNLKNTIVAGNFDPSSDPDCFGALTSQGHNLIQIVAAGCTIGGVTTGNVTGQSADLGPLALNPPGTTETHALLVGSPAINAGSPDCPPPATDQRGAVRPQSGACDIGAYESPFSPTPTPSPTPVPTPVPTPTPVGQTSTPVGQTSTPTLTPTPIGQTPSPTPVGQTPTPTPTGQTPTPTGTGVTPTPTGSAPPLHGDADCNGDVDFDDVLAILEFIALLSPPPECFDRANVNCDAVVDERDALLIVLHLAGVPEEPPNACPPIRG